MGRNNQKPFNFEQIYFARTPLDKPDQVKYDSYMDKQI